MFLRYLIIIGCTALVSSLITYFLLFNFDNKNVLMPDTKNIESEMTLGENIIVIGFVGDLSGEASSYVLPALNAVQIAVDEINNSGLIGGSILKVVTKDSNCLYDEAVEKTEDLIREYNPVYIIGGLCSGETFGVIDAVGDRDILVFSPSSSSADLSGYGNLFFRNIPSDRRTATLLNETIKKDGHNSVVVVSEETEYAKTLASAFASAQNISVISLENEVEDKEYSLEILGDFSFLTGVFVFSDIINQIKILQPDALFLNTQTRVSGFRILKSLRDNNISTPVYSTAILNVIPFGDTIEAVTLYTKGLKIVDNPDLDINNPLTLNLLNKYEERYGMIDGINYYIGSAYDAIYILAEGISMYGLDAEKVAEYLKGIKYKGVIGEYEFEDFGDVRGIELEVKEFINNVPVPVSQNN